jgi:hypothetical protein
MVAMANTKPASKIRPLGAVSYSIAAISGMSAVLIIGIIAKRETDSPASFQPFALSLSRTVINGVPSTVVLGDVKVLPGGFQRYIAPSIALPNLNDQSRMILIELSGRWSDGTYELNIDAQKLVGSMTGLSRDGPQPIIVRDVSGPMITADIGKERFVFLRRGDGLAVSGASLPAVLELHRN